MQENKEQKEKTTMKKTKSNIVVILLILTIIVVATFGYYAYSKYTSTLTGNGQATVAKWSFKVNGQTEQFATINLAETIDQTNNIAEGRIAPGTSGSFDLELDGTGSEVAIDYTITMDLSEKPQNLIFYEDSNYQVPAATADGTATINGYIKLSEVNTIQTRRIYWNWPYETGTTENEIKENDKTDTTDSSKGSIVLPITVTAVQRDPSSSATVGGIRLADVVSVGDYVNYNAASGNGAGKSYTTDSSVTGYSSDTGTTFSSSDTMQWRVLSVDKATGTVELMSADPTENKVWLNGKTGFTNAETVLNDVGAVYGHGKGATGGRSITVEDIEQYSSYDPYTFGNSNSSTGYYGGTKEYTSGTFYKEIKDEDGKVTGYETSATTASSTSPVTMTQTLYGYTAKSYFENSTAYNMIFKKSTDTSTNKSFGLASRCVHLESSFCHFGVRNVSSGTINNSMLLGYNGNASSLVYAVSAVVSLKSNIQTSGQDENGAWNLIVE